MYCSLEDLLARYSEDVLIDITTDGTVDDTVINQAKVDGTIADVSALVDSYLQKEYNVPLSPVPRVINKISVDTV